jgi:hypothetical protein
VSFTSAVTDTLSTVSYTVFTLTAVPTAYYTNDPADIITTTSSSGPITVTVTETVTATETSTSGG